MVPVPTPPTDNLYKYAAIAGLAGAVVLIVFVTSEGHKLLDRGFQIRTDLAMLLADGKDLSEDIERTRAEQNRLEQRLKEFKDKPKTVTEQQVQDVQRTHDALDRKVDDLQQRRRSTERKRIALDEASKRWDSETSNIRLLMAVEMVLSTLLLIISFVGFRAWYVRVQRLQDRRLQIELSQLERTSATPGTAPSASDSPEASSTSAPD